MTDNKALSFQFYPTVDNLYMLNEFDRFMINFSSRRWRNRQKKIVTNKELIVDSGGFHEITNHGRYRYSIDHYLEKIRDVLQPDIFATMDWMCEPQARQQSGLTTEQHIEKTVENTKEILGRDYSSSQPMAVIQGWRLQDYVRCIDRMKDEDVLTERLGIGSICRSGDKQRVKNIILKCREELPSKYNLHGFGIKKSFLDDPQIVKALDFSDSMAWSYGNQKTVDLRGKDRKPYLAVWAREVEFRALKSVPRPTIKEINRIKQLREELRDEKQRLEEVVERVHLERIQKSAQTQLTEQFNGGLN